MSTGKGTKSVRKSQQGNDVIPSVGFLNTVAKHKATLGQTVINLGSLTTPTEATALGFIQPSGGTLAAMDLQRYKNNVKVQSTLRGLMDNPLDYRVTGQSQITLNVAAFEDEIFTIMIESQPRSGINLVAAQPKVQSYMLPVGQTDIPAGVYTVNKNPGEDVGEFMVIVDRVLQYRNTGNGTSGGDYQELTGIIRLNDADLVNVRKVTMVWVGALVDNPQDSQLALIQTLSGQIDAMVPTLAALAGVSQNVFQVAPNDPDLVAFGAEVIAQAARILALENPPACELHIDTGNGHGSTNTRIRRFTNVRANSLGSYLTYADDASLGMSITCNIAGRYEFTYADYNNAGSGAIGISLNTAVPTTNVSALSYAQGKRTIINTPGAATSSSTTITLDLNPGDVVRAHTSANVNGADDNVFFRAIRVGN